MFSTAGKTTGPSPVVPRREARATNNKNSSREDAVLGDALHLIPSLSRHPPSVVESSTQNGGSAKEHAASSTTLGELGADDEALLLQELVNITAATTPFVPSKPPVAAASSGEPSLTKGTGGVSLPQSTVSTPAGSAVDKAPPATSSMDRKSSSTTPSTAAAAAAATAPASTKASSATKTRRSPPALTSNEEQDILDALLAAVDGQQSSVSGDLTGSSGGGGVKASTSSSLQLQRQQDQEEVEQDAVDRIIEEAKMLATSTVLCDTQRGELVLHIHEHVALRRQLGELTRTIGTPTCVAVAEVPQSHVKDSSGARGDKARRSSARPSSSSEAPPAGRTLTVAVGTNLGVVALFDQRWSLMGLCGSVEANVVNARGAVVSLSLSATPWEASEEQTAATGHAKGVFILWSLHSLAPLRIIEDECTVPILRVLHLHRDPTRVLVLESSGTVKLFQFWRVMTKYVLRSTTVTTPSAATPVSDLDTLPFPSAFYLRNLPTIKAHLPGGAATWCNEIGQPWLLTPPPIPPASAANAGVSRTSWATERDKHLVAAVSNDTVLVYVAESGLQGAVTGVARHTHPPSSAVSNELIRFVVLEQDGAAPRILLCVSWNTEVELLLLNLLLPTTTNSAGSVVGDAVVQGVKRLALLRVTAPLLQMVPLAGCSVLLLDQNSDAQLMDASVAVLVEQHHFGALEYVSFASRLSGAKYHGTAASNQTAALLLGKNRAYGVSVYSWRERLATLFARRRFAEALDLAKGFAEEVALSMVGLSSNAAQRRRELHQYVERILLAYVESSCVEGAAPSARAASLLDVLQHVAAYCSSMDALDLLYGSVTRVLQQRGFLSHFLYVLERTMRNGSITYMPEPLLERFIDLFMNKAELTAVEVALGVQQQPPSHGSISSPAIRGSSSAGISPLSGDAISELGGRERAEEALMCLDSGLPNLLRLAQEHRLLRLAVTILSYRQKRYVEALSYALDEEEKEEEDKEGKGESASTATGASVAVDLVEYTLKDSALLAGAEIPASEQRPAKQAVLSFLLGTDARGRHHLLRFVRRQPEHAIRVLLFALSDESLCSPWTGSSGEFCRTQFVSSVFFILTGGTRTRPRLSRSDGSSGQPNIVPLNLFLMGEEELTRRPDLRLLRAAELAQRSFPPYAAVHTFLSNAALFDELLLSDVDREHAASSSAADVRLDVWMDLVIQDALFVFQNAETAEERLSVQEQLISVMAPPFVPMERVTLYQPDFARLRMARCLAALLCKEQRYTEAIRCYIDPVQYRIDARLQHDVLEMLRCEMQRLQHLRAHTARQQQLSDSRRLDSEILGEGEEERGGSAASPEAATSPAHSRTSRMADLSQHTSTSSLALPASSNASALPTAHVIDDAIKALQRAVMGQVEALVRIDATGLAQFIFDYLPSNHREVMRLLRGSSVAFLDYLDELIAQGDPTVAGDINLQNTYIELLCAHAPQRVFAHLQERGGSITYDVQLALRAVRKYRITDASIYLLEKTMMIEEAVAVMEGAARAALAAVREDVLARVSVSAAAEGAHDKEETKDARGSAGKGGLKLSFASASSRGSLGSPGVLAKHPLPQQSDSASEAAEGFLTGPSAVPAAPELLRLVEVGKELCRKYQSDRMTRNNDDAAAARSRGPSCPLSSRNPDYWFRLLDVFMVPRRLLCEVVTQDEQLQLTSRGEDAGSEEHDDARGDVGAAEGTGMRSELEVAALFAVAARSSPLSGRDGHYTAPALPPSSTYHLPRLTQPLTPPQRRAVTALVTMYTHCSSDVLRAMVGSLDLTLVVDKVVQDNKEEAFRPFKPIILDMMASLRFDLEASRLCESATESDVMLFGRELYQKLKTGVVALSDCCALCHHHLSEPPSIAAAAGESSFAPVPTSSLSQSPSLSAVCVYTCGHAYHTLCCLQGTGSAQQQQQQGGCYVCALQRFSSPPPPISSGVNDTRRRSANGQQAITAGVPTVAPNNHSSRSRHGAAVDVARMQRRIRQTKVKLDRTEDLYPLLKSYLTWGGPTPTTPAHTTPGTAREPGGGGAAAAASGATNSTARDVEGGNWVLAPSPRVPAAIGEVIAAPAGEKALDVETLTDAEILELFGSL